MNQRLKTLHIEMMRLVKVEKSLTSSYQPHPFNDHLLRAIRKEKHQVSKEIERYGKVQGRILLIKNKSMQSIGPVTNLHYAN
ncbi:hypothetical protein LGQ02_20960 [Bacillus shivajii]|uniref:hypothetical protein n=1 Tax=Bacillus shivajii TaxID=1983719 RepID=UPI001CFA963F|nr:hypothetical protein [Bacillus shivajii]UCZ53209.1 hypothetical protein LGQ02_20960 [Bacillus shivajii]